MNKRDIINQLRAALEKGTDHTTAEHSDDEIVQIACGFIVSKQENLNEIFGQVVREEIEKARHESETAGGPRVRVFGPDGEITNVPEGLKEVLRVLDGFSADSAESIQPTAVPSFEAVLKDLLGWCERTGGDPMAPVEAAERIVANLIVQQQREAEAIDIDQGNENVLIELGLLHEFEAAIVKAAQGATPPSPTAVLQAVLQAVADLDWQRKELGLDDDPLEEVIEAMPETGEVPGDNASDSPGAHVDATEEVSTVIEGFNPGDAVEITVTEDHHPALTGMTGVVVTLDSCPDGMCWVAVHRDTADRRCFWFSQLRHVSVESLSEDFLEWVGEQMVDAD